MVNYMLVGCDLHDKSMLLQIAHNREKAVTRSFGTDRAGRSRAIVELKRRAEEAGGAEIVFAYEACAQGFGLHDDLTEDGIRCFVLAPTRISRSTKARKSKTEMGDLSRFENRRQVGSYLGLVPSSAESGEDSDRKGHITHQGSRRGRGVLDGKIKKELPQRKRRRRDPRCLIRLPTS
ncbi:MAG: transposase [Planctomycetota bacterium]